MAGTAVSYHQELPIVNVWYFGVAQGTSRLPFTLKGFMDAVCRQGALLKVDLHEFSPHAVANAPSEALKLIDHVERLERGELSDPEIPSDEFMRLVQYWEGMNEADVWCDLKTGRGISRIRVQAIDSTVWRIAGPAEDVDQIALEVLKVEPRLYLFFAAGHGYELPT